MAKNVPLTIRLAAFCFLLSCSSHAAKMVVVVPPLFSLCREQAVLACELTKRGHDVTFYVSAATEREFIGRCLSECGLPMRNITWRQDQMPMTGEQLWNSAIGGVELDQNISKAVRDFCIPQIADTDAMDVLKAERFDLALMEGTYPLVCFYVVPYLLKIPYITESTFLFDFPRIRPWLPHMVPSTSSKFSDNMSFLEKFQNLFSSIMMYAVSTFMVPIKEINAYAPNLSRFDVVSLIEKSEIFLENVDPIAGYPIPTWPNVIQAGGFATRPARPLSEDYVNFIGNSENGVIILSFGSLFTVVPENVLEKIQASFQSLKYNFIVKAQNNKRVGNILFQKWIPQNDLLAQKQTKLFIAHCGNNGLYEAIYHGIPMLCLPIGMDQHYNAKRMESLGIGKKLDIKSFTSNQLTKQILSIVENKEYGDKAKILSSRFHGLPQHPREKAVDWIEYVMKHGGQHLRPRALDMPFYQYFMLDMIGLVVVIMHVSAYLFIKGTRVLCRLVFKRKFKRD